MDTDFTLPKAGIEPKPSTPDLWWVLVLAAMLAILLIVIVLKKRDKSEESHDYPQQNYGIHTLENQIQEAEMSPSLPPQQAPGYSAYAPPPPPPPSPETLKEDTKNLEASDSEE